jgi:hypothetical protein
VPLLLEPLLTTAPPLEELLPVEELPPSGAAEPSLHAAMARQTTSHVVSVLMGLYITTGRGLAILAFPRGEEVRIDT